MLGWVRAALNTIPEVDGKANSPISSGERPIDTEVVVALRLTPLGPPTLKVVGTVYVLPSEVFSVNVICLELAASTQ